MKIMDVGGELSPDFLVDRLRVPRPRINKFFVSDKTFAPRYMSGVDYLDG